MWSWIIILFIGCGGNDRAPQKKNEIGENQTNKKNSSKIKHESKKVNLGSKEIYPFKTAVIEYDISGKDIKTGNKIVWISAHGMLEKHVIKRVNPNSEITTEMILFDGLDKYTIDLKNNSGYHSKLTNLYMDRMAFDMDSINPKKVQKTIKNRKLLNRKDMTKEKQKTKIAGFECNLLQYKTEDKSYELAVYKGLILKNTVFSGKSKKPIRMELAKVIKIDADISLSEFELSQDINIKKE